MYLCSVMTTAQRHIGLQRHGEDAVTGEAQLKAEATAVKLIVEFTDNYTIR